MPEIDKKKLLEDLQPPPLKPIMTGLFILLWAGTSFLFLSTVNAQTGTMDWLINAGFSVNKMNQALSAGINGLGALAALLYIASCSQFSGFTWVINCIFLWIFGSHVERQTSNIRFLILFVLLIPCGFLLVSSDPWGGPASTLYATPILPLCALLGAYMSMAPQKTFRIHIWTKPAWEIHQPARPTPEPNFTSPWHYAIAFFLWAILSELAVRTPASTVAAMTHLPYMQQIQEVVFGKPPIGEHVSVLSPLSALGSVIIGAIAGYIFHGFGRSSTNSEAGDLQIQAVLRYKELRKLDMKHEEAVSAVAKLLNVPMENARDWIKHGVQPIRDSER